MSKWEDMLQGLVKNAGAAGVKELEGALSDLEAAADNPMKRALLSLAADAVGEYGLVGLDKVSDLIAKIGDEKEPDLEFASLKARSDYLAALQNAEADEKSKAKDFFKVLGEKLAVVLKAIISGLVG